jgi:hypothetical protein
LPQGRDHVTELLIVQVHILEEALQLERLLDTLPGLAAELSDVARRETAVSRTVVCTAPVSAVRAAVRATEASLLASLLTLALLALLTLALLTLLTLALLTLLVLTLLALSLLAPLTESA